MSIHQFPIQKIRNKNLQKAIKIALTYPNGGMCAPKEIKDEVIRWHDPKKISKQTHPSFGLYAAILNGDLEEKLKTLASTMLRC